MFRCTECEREKPDPCRALPKGEQAICSDCFSQIRFKAIWYELGNKTEHWLSGVRFSS